nr:hypothetical protein [Herbaspirillum sp. B39]
MTVYSEHYIPVKNEAPFLLPQISKLAEIWFDIADDVSSAVRKWEEMDFIRLSSTDGTNEGPQDQTKFIDHAIAIGASLVVYNKRQVPVYLAPLSLSARQQAELFPKCGSCTAVIHGAVPTAATHIAPRIFDASLVHLVHTTDLSGDVSAWKEKGFITLGTADIVAKNGDQGVSLRLKSAAVSADASLVFFQITPAKLRTIRRDLNGRIDMGAVRADPPAGIHASGSSVIQAVFLAPISSQARETAKSELPGSYVPVELKPN